MQASMSTEIKILTGISQIDEGAWNALCVHANSNSSDIPPILSHAFLSALEDTGCVGSGTGWQPYPIVVLQHGKLVGAVPLYLKTQSYGEYVFDWAWAEAYERNGLSYYPKLLVAVPFTPITGARLLSADSEIQALLAQALTSQMMQHSLSSTHVLFPDEASAKTLKDQGWLERSGVQFRWENEQFQDFEDFLSRLSHDKRKKIRQERKKILSAGVICKKLAGGDITQVDWDFFFSCYENTYREHRSTPYLTREFFYQIGRRMPQNILLVIAELNGQPIAAAFNLFDGTTLYGRYWGAKAYVPGLHFELCYYQAQEFCITQSIRYFEGGAQGEHKLARGFRPRATRSFHQIAHPDFEAAIKNFVEHEAKGMGAYQHELEERAPFKSMPAFKVS